MNLFRFLGSIFGSYRGAIGGRTTVNKNAVIKEMSDNKLKHQRRLLNRGCDYYTIDGITVLALNEKNAVRKVNNIKKSLKN